MVHHHAHQAHSPTHVRMSLVIHAAAFCVVNALLVLINLSTGDHYWFQWPLLGWGAGLAFHAWAVSRRVELDSGRRQVPEPDRDRPGSSNSHGRDTA